MSAGQARTGSLHRRHNGFELLHRRVAVSQRGRRGCSSGISLTTIHRLAGAVVPCLLTGLLTACVPGGESPNPTEAEPSTAGLDSPGSVTPVLMPDDADPDGELRRELLAMLRRDQTGRTGGVDPEGDAARTARLREILETHGWPTESAVGQRGALAAWTIAQHADLEPTFQRRALRLLKLAVAKGEGSPGNLAYLTDRVAVGQGKPQTYGTQLRCAPKGPSLATPLARPRVVDRLRQQAGLPPLADYRAEFQEACGHEQ